MDRFIRFNVITLIVIVLCSCNKESVDTRDNYTGVYNLSKVERNSFNDEFIEAESLFDELIASGLEVEKDHTSSKMIIFDTFFWLDDRNRGTVNVHLNNGEYGYSCSFMFLDNDELSIEVDVELCVDPDGGFERLGGLLYSGNQL